MKKALTLSFLAAILVSSLPADAQTTASRNDARSDGKAVAKEQQAKMQARAKNNAATGLDMVDQNDPSQLEALADNEAALSSTAASAVLTHQGAAVVRSSRQQRARFNARDIEAVWMRANSISANASTLTGVNLPGGTQGQCTPLPNGSSSVSRYFATCNSGITISQETRQCRTALNHQLTTQTHYHYVCDELSAYTHSGYPSCSIFAPIGCTVSGSLEGPCLQWGKWGGRLQCVEPGEPLTEMACPQPVANQSLRRTTEQVTVQTVESRSSCQTLEDRPECARRSRVCIDSEPKSRIIEGQTVTRECWGWQKEYSCTGQSSQNDCSVLEARADCRFARRQCLSDDTPCTLFEEIYDCAVPATPGSSQYLCQGDVYCLDGACEPLERQPNQEFQQAAAALHAMQDARTYMDENSLRLFTGSRASCSAKVFGAINCCRGKGFSLSLGLNELLGLGCDAEERSLHERDAKGLCSYIGSYCSAKILGVCTTKRKAYCCFESKLSRILQEQGRAQLNLPWGNPKTETCRGFTMAEFARLDLSKMNFAEVYAEFTDAVRLPRELDLASEIQSDLQSLIESGQP